MTSRGMCQSGIEYIHCSNLHGSHSLETGLVSSYVADNTISLQKASSSTHLLDIRSSYSREASSVVVGIDLKLHPAAEERMRNNLSHFAG